METRSVGNLVIHEYTVSIFDVSGCMCFRISFSSVGCVECVLSLLLSLIMICGNLLHLVWSWRTIFFMTDSKEESLISFSMKDDYPLLWRTAKLEILV